MADPMRILLLDTNDAMGGVVRVHLCLLEAVDRERFDLRLACEKDSPLQATFAAVPGQTVVPVKTGTKAPGQSGGWRGRWNDARGLLSLFRASLRLIRYCRRERIQLIHTSDKKRALVLTLLLHRLTGIPFLYHIHNVYVDYRANRRALSQATAIIANSGDMRRDFIENLGVAMERIEVVYNGIDPDHYKPREAVRFRKACRLPEDRVLIGIVSRLAPDKGQDTFLRAAAIVLRSFPEAHFVLVGDDAIYSNNADYVPALRRIVEDTGIGEHVTFAGFQSDMVDVYNTLDIVVNAALREAFGMVVVEPMACAKPVIGTDAGGIPEILEDGEIGLLFPPGDEEALAQALLRLCEDGPLRKDMGERGRARVMERFTIAAQARAVEAVYEKTGRPMK